MPVRERRPGNRASPTRQIHSTRYRCTPSRSVGVGRWTGSREDRDTARQCRQKIAPTPSNAPPSHATAIWWYLASSSAAPSKPRYKSRTSGSMTALTRLGATRTTPSPSRLNTSQTRRSSASSRRPTGSRSPSHSSASRSSRHQRGQITLRFPVARGQPPNSLGPHLDGIPTPLNGVPTDGQIHNFTILAGVFLSDCPAGDHGNFTVWPGTHLETARWLRAHGTSVSDPDAFFAAIRNLAHETSRPMPLAVHAGDLLLAHYLLLHSSGRHRGPNIRYAVFYRLQTQRHAEVAARLPDRTMARLAHIHGGMTPDRRSGAEGGARGVPDRRNRASGSSRSWRRCLAAFFTALAGCAP